MLGAGENPLLAHAWGISPGADRIWAQIAGMAPSLRGWERGIVVFQAYMDESRSDNATFVLAGYVSTAEKWAKFSQSWEPLLPFSTKNKVTGNYRFKMSEMARRLSDVLPFYRVIEDNVMFALSCKIQVSDLERAADRIWIEDFYIDLRQFRQPYWFALSGLLGNFHFRED